MTGCACFIQPCLRVGLPTHIVFGGRREWDGQSDAADGDDSDSRNGLRGPLMQGPSCKGEQEHAEEKASHVVGDCCGVRCIEASIDPYEPDGGGEERDGGGLLE